MRQQPDHSGGSLNDRTPNWMNHLTFRSDSSEERISKRGKLVEVLDRKRSLNLHLAITAEQLKKKSFHTGCAGPRGSEAEARPGRAAAVHEGATVYH